MREHIITYENWKKDENLSPLLVEEINSLKKDSDLEDRFYKKLEFGTAGVRGLLGVGTNRMNVHTVAEVIQALSLKIKREGSETSGVVIGYDTRRMSREFSELSASILSRNGIKVYLFDEICTTPLLSYAIRNLKTKYGIMITASHNPKEYNGCKVYGEDGTQINEEVANEISDLTNTISNLLAINVSIDLENVETPSEEVYNSYIDKVLELGFNEEVDKDISVVYTPLHGTGLKAVSQVLASKGFENVHFVEGQKDPDSEFSTVKSPNPEEPSAFELAIKTGLTHNADILVATDPDADRVGVMVKHNGRYEYLSGNTIGTLMVNYILENLFAQGRIPSNAKIVKTIVSSELANKIAEVYGVEIVDVHVGFKNIYSKVNEWEAEGDFGYLIGYEESLGFGIGSEIARDKDAISATLLLVEMAAHYKKIGMSLYDVYKEIQEKHGFQGELLKSITLPGKDGKEKMDSIVESFRNNGVQLKSFEVVETIDYISEGKNVLKFKCSDGSWFVVRPSGTEPKLKLYFYANGESIEDSNEKVELLKNEFESLIC